MNIYIVIDMQNDFITGSLANKDAENIVEPITNFLEKIQKKKNTIVIATRDTHQDDYLETYEGKNLPIAHCIEKTEGWQINSKILEPLTTKTKEFKNKKLLKNVFLLDKEWFNAGETEWDMLLQSIEYDFGYGLNNIEDIVLMGTCTDICVISNAFSLKALFPEQDITILSDLCAGLTPEKHNAALEVMKSCQMKVMTSEEYLNEK